MSNLQLEIVTPQKTLLQTEADYITVPSEMGEMGIFPGHIPVLANLRSGVLSYKKGSDVKKVAIHFGYAEICKDTVTILANIAELAEEIDQERASNELAAAEKELTEVFKDSAKVDMAADLQRTIKKSVTRQTATK